MNKYFWVAQNIKGDLKSGVVSSNEARQAWEYACQLATSQYVIIKLERIE